MLANYVPQNTLTDLITELMIVLDRNESHTTRVRLGARGCVELVLRVSPDGLGPASFWTTDTSIVKKLLEP